MGRFGKTDGPQDPDEDVIIIHLGHLSDERYNRVVESITAFMNARGRILKILGLIVDYGR